MSTAKARRPRARSRVGGPYLTSLRGPDSPASTLTDNNSPVPDEVDGTGEDEAGIGEVGGTTAGIDEVDEADEVGEADEGDEADGVDEGDEVDEADGVDERIAEDGSVAESEGSADWTHEEARLDDARLRAMVRILADQALSPPKLLPLDRGSFCFSPPRAFHFV